MLTDVQWKLLEWLSKEDFTPYGSCHGPDLDVLLNEGLATTTGRDPHSTVSVTERGFDQLRQHRHN